MRALTGIFDPGFDREICDRGFFSNFLKITVSKHIFPIVDDERYCVNDSGQGETVQLVFMGNGSSQNRVPVLVLSQLFHPESGEEPYHVKPIHGFDKPKMEIERT